MKRIALLLAAVVSGSGCVVDTTAPTGSITVEWSDVLGFGTFVAYNGASGLDCGSSNFTGISNDGYGISWVDVYVDGVPHSAPCNANWLTIDGLSTGWHDVVVEGTDNAATPNVLVRDWESIDVFDSGDTLFSSTPGETRIKVDYAFYEAGGCLATGVGPYTGPDYISFDLRDDISRVTVTYDRTFTCSNYNAILRVPWSKYTVTWAGEEQWNTTAPAGYDVLRATSGTHGLPSVSTSAWNPASYPVPISVDLSY